MPTTGTISDLCRTKQASGSPERSPVAKVQEAHPARTKMMRTGCEGILRYAEGRAQGVSRNLNECREASHEASDGWMQKPDY